MNKAGSEFYFGEKVPVWASTTGDKEDMTYEWSATGGTFDGWRTQNLYENLWIAPNIAGEYTVTVTARNDGNSSTKSTNMKVTRYYFDEFQSAYTLNGNGWSLSNIVSSGQKLITDVDPANSRLELTATSTSAPNIRRTLDLAELKIPFSIRTILGWKTYFRANSTITLSIFFKQPSNPTYPYLREIRWEIWPTVNPATTDNYQIRYETFVPATNTSKFSTVGNTAPNPLPLISPVKGKFDGLAIANGALKNLSFSVDANNVFHAYVDGTLWFTSNGIKDWLEYARTTFQGFEDPVARE
ncbi:MAG TPA: PKD domain-containing protein, partial [Chitinophagaceae bacterium]|nr:PKD domain-containing protein [Chitinophagaceae bacterium]